MDNTIKRVIEKHRGETSYLETRLGQLIAEIESELNKYRGITREQLKREILKEIKDELAKNNDPLNISILTKIVQNVLKGAGPKPEKGVDYFTAEEINAIKEEVRPKKGVDYHDGEKGEDAPTGDELLAIITPFLPKPEKGNDGSPDTPQQVRDKLQSLRGGERLDKTAIKGLAEEV